MTEKKGTKHVKAGYNNSAVSAGEVLRGGRNKLQLLDHKPAYKGTAWHREKFGSTKEKSQRGESWKKA